MLTLLGIITMGVASMAAGADSPANDNSATSSRASDDRPQTGVDLEGPGVERFDPTLEAMKAVAGVDRAAFANALETRKSDAGKAAQQVLDEVDAVRSNLYERASNRPEAAPLQEQWSSCMAKLGYEIAPGEAADMDEIDDVSMSDAWLACEDQVAKAFDVLVQEEYPAWLEAHRSTFERYAAVLGL